MDSGEGADAAVDAAESGSPGHGKDGLRCGGACVIRGLVAVITAAEMSRPLSTTRLSRLPVVSCDAALAARMRIAINTIARFIVSPIVPVTDPRVT